MAGPSSCHQKQSQYLDNSIASFDVNFYYFGTIDFKRKSCNNGYIVSFLVGENGLILLIER